MPDRAVENAKAMKDQLLARKRRLLAELQDIDDQIGRIDAFVKDWHLFAESDPESAVDKLADVNANKAATSQPVKRKATGNSRKEDVAAAARYVILERGVPIMRDELYDLLTAQGMVIQGKDPQMVLSTMLWRMRDQIARVKGGGYWPADIPNQEAGYDPATATDLDDTRNIPPSELRHPDRDVLRQSIDAGFFDDDQP